MNSYPSFDFISISSNDFIEVQIATVIDFHDFISKLKGERGVALSQHIMFNLNTFTQEEHNKINQRRIN